MDEDELDHCDCKQVFEEGDEPYECCWCLCVGVDDDEYRHPRMSDRER